ncbi:MAG: hypothetical protein QNJ41_04125 [Xenococcaceae cyanobacterium MO_188.B32]|nr:hypothetical protein [Xenococcaceae cyanobacterium MO_188.B32]
MKFQIKALSATLVLASLLGACSSVNSSTPSVDEPSVNSGIELESSEGLEGVEEVPTDSAEIESSDYQTTEEPTTELDSAEMEGSDYQTTEEPTTELDSAEMEGSDYQTTEEPTTTELDSAEMDSSDLETAEQETPEIESSEAPLESDGSEVILPVEDAAETPTESEAAENSTLEPAQ